jgi:hypothetical protein
LLKLESYMTVKLDGPVPPDVVQIIMKDMRWNLEACMRERTCVMFNADINHDAKKEIIFFINHSAYAYTPNAVGGWQRAPYSASVVGSKGLKPKALVGTIKEGPPPYYDVELDHGARIIFTHN